MKRIISGLAIIALFASPSVSFAVQPNFGGGIPGFGNGQGNPCAGPAAVHNPFCGGRPPVNPPTPPTPPVTPPTETPAAKPADQPAQQGSRRSNLGGKIAMAGTAIYMYAAVCNHTQWRVATAAKQKGVDPVTGEQITDFDGFFATYCGLGIGKFFPTGPVTAPWPGDSEYYNNNPQ